MKRIVIWAMAVVVLSTVGVLCLDQFVRRARETALHKYDDIAPFYIIANKVFTNAVVRGDAGCHTNIADYCSSVLLTKEEQLMLARLKARYYPNANVGSVSDGLIACFLENRRMWLIVTRSGDVKTVTGSMRIQPKGEQGNASH